MSNEIPQELYDLQPVVDNPLFEGFALTDAATSLLGRESLVDDMTPGYGVSESERRWSQIRLRDVWRPPRVIGRVASFNDYPCIDLLYPAFSKRACDALHDFLAPNGELLPVESDVGQQYFFYNITTIVDALDVDRSECEFWCEPPTTAVAIDYFAFHRDRLAGLSIFRIHEWTAGIIVSNQFADRVEECGLRGFEFVKLWPHERGIDWRMEGKKRSGERVGPKNPKRHTLVLILPLRRAKPNAKEARTIKRLEDELDAHLAVPSLDLPYFGSYEGSETVNAEFRMFLSCPDVDALEKKLRPWLSRLEWRVTAYAVKRYGTMHDEDASESMIEIP